MKYVLKSHNSWHDFLIPCLAVVGVPIAVIFWRYLKEWFPPPEESEGKELDVEREQQEEADAKPGSLEQRYANWWKDRSGMGDGPEVNGLAIASLILGLAAVFLFLIGAFIQDAMLLCIPGIVGPIAGLVGSAASRQIRSSEGSQQGSEIALVGTILGVCSILLLVAYFVYLDPLTW